MDFDIPSDIQELLGRLDAFIEDVIRPLEQQDDNIRFFDHRREDARTDWDRGGLPERGVGAAPAGRPSGSPTKPGFYRYPFPKEYGRHGRHQPRVWL